MLRIDDTIFSLDIIGKKFCCNLQKCHRTCCRYGDSGAPLSTDEVDLLDVIWPEVRPFLRPEGIATIVEWGTSTLDIENEYVTPLINNQDCAFSVFEGETLRCGIEKAWTSGKICFQKPLSCHLFPIRIKQFNNFRAVNYETLTICAGGREKGNTDGIYLYEFLRIPLIRALGERMFYELCMAADQLKNNSGF
jgi:hypothetical protein